MRFADIMALNKIIMAGYYNSGMPNGGAFFATTLTAGVFTFMMGLVVNVPVALAPGMGLNGYFAHIATTCWDPSAYGGKPGFLWTDKQLNEQFYSKTCPDWGKNSLPWTDAMGAVFISGWFYLFFTLTGLRGMLFKAVPPSLRSSITVGIGFFITIIGLKIGQITRYDIPSFKIGGAVDAGMCFTDTAGSVAAMVTSAVSQPSISPLPMVAGSGLNSVMYAAVNQTVQSLFAGPASTLGRGMTASAALAMLPALQANISASVAGSINPFGIPVPLPPGVVNFCNKNTGVDLDPVTFNLGIVSFKDHPPARIAVLGLALVAFFSTLRVKSAIIISIVLATFVGINYSTNVGAFMDVSAKHDGSKTALMTPSRSSSGKFSTFYTLDPRDGVNANACTPPATCPVSAVTDLSSWYAYNTLMKQSFPAGGISKSTARDHFFLPDMSVIPSGKLTFKFARKPIFWDAVWTFLFVELFDSFGTLTGIMTRAGYVKRNAEGGMTKVNRAMLVDGCSLWMGGLIGANSCTCYIESNTGIEAGARTGFASIITGSAFLLSLIFVFPFVQIIPDAATTCALVMVGVYSLQEIRHLNFDDPIDLLSAFFTISIMGFTYSISNGICVGFIFYAFMKTTRFVFQKLALKLRPSLAYEEGVDCELPHPIMFLIAGFSAVRFQYLGPGLLRPPRPGSGATAPVCARKP